MKLQTKDKLESIKTLLEQYGDDTKLIAKKPEPQETGRMKKTIDPSFRWGGLLLGTFLSIERKEVLENKYDVSIGAINGYSIGPTLKRL